MLICAILYLILFTGYKVSNVVANFTESRLDSTVLSMDNSNKIQNNSQVPWIKRVNKYQTHNPVLVNHTVLFEIIKLEKIRRQKRSSDLDLCQRSLCPWTIEWDNDMERNPMYIAKAVCSSKCLLNFTGLETSQLDILTTCEPFTRDIRIFKHSNETYLRDWPVACICTRKLISKVPAIPRKGRSGLRKANLKKHRRRRRRRNQNRLVSKKQRTDRKHYKRQKQIAIKRQKKVKRRRCRIYYNKKHQHFRSVLCFSKTKVNYRES